MTAAVAAADRTAAEADADRAHLFRTTALVIFAQSVLAVVAFVGLSAAAVLVSTLEQFRFGAEDALGLVNAVGVTAFNFWLVALGVVLLLRARARGRGRAA